MRHRQRPPGCSLSGGLVTSFPTRLKCTILDSPSCTRHHGGTRPTVLPAAPPQQRTAKRNRRCVPTFIYPARVDCRIRQAAANAHTPHLPRAEHRTTQYGIGGTRGSRSSSSSGRRRWLPHWCYPVPLPGATKRPRRWRQHRSSRCARPSRRPFRQRRSWTCRVRSSPRPMT
jgi:hypothetical protein